MDEKKEKRVLNNEPDENVKKVSTTGLGDDETVVMKQELDEEELDQATGGRREVDSYMPDRVIRHKCVDLPDEDAPSQGPCKFNI